MTSSKPTTATSCWRPSSRKATMVPIVMRFWAVKSAVGGSGHAAARAQPAERARCRRGRAVRAPASARCRRRRVRRDSPRGARQRLRSMRGRRGTRSAGDRWRSAARSAVRPPPRLSLHDGVTAQELRWAIDKDQRDAGLVVAHQVALVAGRRARSTSPSTPRAANASASSRSRCSFSSEEPTKVEYSVCARDVLDAAMHGGEERVGDVLDDQADARRLPVRPPQRAGGHVAPVAEHLRRRRARARRGRAGPRPLPLITRETVARLTSAVRATSFIVGRRSGNVVTRVP